MSRVFHIVLESEPEWVQSREADGFFRLAGERRALLNAAWREHVGHTNPNKLDALPLPEAQARAEAMLPDIAALAAAEGGAASPSVSEWHGFKRTDFYANGRECVLVEPKTAAPGRPWVWRTEFFGAFADADLALLARGWHVAYCRLSHLYGCPSSAELMEAFRKELAASFGLDAKPVLFGFSRGGLYALRYAAAYPHRAAGLYLDAPVVDVCSWPGGMGSGRRAAREWRDCLDVYGVPEARAGEIAAELIGSLEAPASRGLPLLIVTGDADLDVPMLENAAVLVREYESRGGSAELIVKPGCAHHPHSLADVTPIIAFAEACAGIETESASG